MAAETIYIEEEYINAAANLKKLYTSEFKESYKDLEKLYTKLEADKGFQGKAKKGYIETLRILLDYQKDIIEAMDGYYDKYKELDEELKEIEKTSYYKGVNG